MRVITMFSEHVYTTKASAMRAARNAVGLQYVVEAPELGNRFDGVITIGTDMIGVVAVGNGWQWNYTFDLADVQVKVRYADGTIAEVRYAEVAHWQDATTPPVEPATSHIEQQMDVVAPDCPILANTPAALLTSSDGLDQLSYDAYLKLQAFLNQPCPMQCDHEGATFGNLCAVCNFPATQVFGAFIKPLLQENRVLRTQIAAFKEEQRIDKLFLTEAVNALHRGIYHQEKARDMLHSWSRELREKNRAQFPASRLKQVFGEVVGLQNW